MKAYRVVDLAAFPLRDNALPATSLAVCREMSWWTCDALILHIVLCNKSVTVVRIFVGFIWSNFKISWSFKIKLFIAFKSPRISFKNGFHPLSHLSQSRFKFFNFKWVPFPSFYSNEKHSIFHHKNFLYILIKSSMQNTEFLSRELYLVLDSRM